MAEHKSNGSPDGHTSELAEFPEVHGKIIDRVELFSDSESFAITLKFEDRTSLHFTMEPAVFAFPTLSDWKDGNETVLKKYKGVRSEIQRS